MKRSEIPFYLLGGAALAGMGTLVAVDIDLTRKIVDSQISHPEGPCRLDLWGLSALTTAGETALILGGIALRNKIDDVRRDMFVPAGVMKG